jgi:hypothetical protein
LNRSDSVTRRQCRWAAQRDVFVITARGLRGQLCCCVSCAVMQVTSVAGMYVAVQWCPACPCRVGASSGLCSPSTCGSLSGHSSVVAATAST